MRSKWTVLETVALTSNPLEKTSEWSLFSLMAGVFGGPYTSMPGQTQNAGQINGQSIIGGNSGSAAGNASFSHLAGMSKNQLYDVMSQMKVLPSLFYLCCIICIYLVMSFARMPL